MTNTKKMILIFLVGIISSSLLYYISTQISLSYNVFMILYSVAFILLTLGSVTILNTLDTSNKIDFKSRLEGSISLIIFSAPFYFLWFFIV